MARQSSSCATRVAHLAGGSQSLAQMGGQRAKEPRGASEAAQCRLLHALQLDQFSSRHRWHAIPLDTHLAVHPLVRSCLAQHENRAHCTEIKLP
jgi:hypothetical protein